jgi:hypothetical protein
LGGLRGILHRAGGQRRRLGIGTPLNEAPLREIPGLLARGDDVVEVALNGVPANRTALERYGLSEEIISYKRRWFTVQDEAPGVLPRMLAHRRPVRHVTATEHANHGDAD